MKKNATSSCTFWILRKAWIYCLFTGSIAGSSFAQMRIFSDRDTPGTQAIVQLSDAPDQIHPRAAFTVRGKVLDENSQPLVGVSVVVKGTTNGTLTDANGAYSLSVETGDETLVFSFIGYLLKEVAINQQSQLDVSLNADVTALNEVVVVGYGTQKKESLTGSVAAVSSKDVNRVHAPTVTGLLAGKVPGVQFRQPDGRPGADANIQIRNMGGNPLFIIDGVPKDKSQFDNISPNDIESIAVLKDASAAIYGSRAANGVIIVTTKRGTPGQKSSINLEAYYGLQNWTRFPKVLNAYEWTLARVEADIYKSNKTEITPDALEKFRQGTEYGYQSFDWYDFVIQPNAPQSSINLNATGGSDRINYYLSVTRLDQNSVMGRQFIFNRTNVQSNIDVKITDDIKVGMTINARLETRKNPGVPGIDDYNAPKNGIFRNYPTERPFANDNPRYLNTISNPASNFGFLNYDLSGYFTENIRVVTPQLSLEYQTPIKGLSVKALYSYMFRDLLRDIHEYTYDTYTYNPTADTYTVTGGSANPYRERGTNKIIEIVGQLQLNYKRTFGKHNVTGIILTERFDRNEKDVFFRSIPKSNVLPIVFFPDAVVYRDGDNTQKRVGYIGRLNYNFDGKYFLEVAARQDASWKFAPEKRWGFFPSASGAWRISEERFYQRLMGGKPILNELKVRTSYGELGDDNIVINGNPLDPFAYIGGYNYNSTTGVINGTAVIGARDRGVPFTRLSWLTARTLDIGLDYGLWNNRITGSLDYFRRVRRGLPSPKNDVFVPSEIGYGLPQENLEKDAVLGVEGSLTYNGSWKGVTFSVGGNLAYARRKFLEPYNERFGNSLDQYHNSQANRWTGIFWGYEVVGQFQSQEEINAYTVNVDGQGNRTLLPGDLIYKDVNGDGIINSRDERPIGYGTGGTPILSGGLFLTASYKGFDLAVDFSMGSMMTFNRTNEQRNAFQNTGNITRYLYEDRWRREDPFNPDSPWIAGKNIPIRYNETGHSNLNRNSTWWRTNVRYLRNRSMELGYTLPADWLKRLHIQKLRLFVNTYNLFSVDNTRQFGLDPEVVDQNGLQYPQTKLLNGGFSVSF